MDEDFQFNPPEMDMSFLNESSGDGLEFTTSNVENTLEEENVFDAPVFENSDITPVVEEIKEENVSEAVPQFESPENISFDMPSEFEVPLENVEEMPNDETIPTNIEAQEKVANAIREKISEIQDAKTEDTTLDMTESKEEVPTFEAVVEEETKISPSPETYQAEPVSKEDIFVEGRKKLKNMMTNESQQSINMIKDEALTK